MTQAYTQQMKRKDEHVGHATQQYQSQSNLELRQTRFVHHPLSEMAVDEVSLQTKMAGFTLETPFFINAITGGSPRTTLINQRLAQLAYETGIAMATGSMSIAMKDPSTAESFTIIRKENPNGIVLANLGAHYTVESAKKAIDLIEANGIQIHVNTLQELVMPEGDRSFHHWLKNIEEIVSHVDVPVIVKEVGFGFSREAMQELINIGVQTIDISGRGGTNFAAIENARREDTLFDELEDWGQTTVQSLVEGYDLPCELIGHSFTIRYRKMSCTRSKCCRNIWRIFTLNSPTRFLTNSHSNGKRVEESIKKYIHPIRRFKHRSITPNRHHSPKHHRSLVQRPPHRLDNLRK